MVGDYTSHYSNNPGGGGYRPTTTSRRSTTRRHHNTTTTFGCDALLYARPGATSTRRRVVPLFYFSQICTFFSSFFSIHAQKTRVPGGGNAGGGEVRVHLA